VLTLRQAQGHPEQRRGMIPRPRVNLILYHGVLPFDFAQGTPSAVEGWRRARRGARGSSPVTRGWTASRPPRSTWRRHRPPTPRADRAAAGSGPS
jgi:hypothetical protein